MNQRPVPKQIIDVVILFVENDAVGVTIVLLTCSYRGQEFVRVGYFINNDYTDPELKEMPPHTEKTSDKFDIN